MIGDYYYESFSLTNFVKVRYGVSMKQKSSLSHAEAPTLSVSHSKSTHGRKDHVSIAGNDDIGQSQVRVTEDHIHAKHVRNVSLSADLQDIPDSDVESQPHVFADQEHQQGEWILRHKTPWPEEAYHPLHGDQFIPHALRRRHIYVIDGHTMPYVEPASTVAGTPTGIIVMFLFKEAGSTFYHLGYSQSMHWVSRRWSAFQAGNPRKLTLLWISILPSRAPVRIIQRRWKRMGFLIPRNDDSWRLKIQQRVPRWWNLPKEEVVLFMSNDASLKTDLGTNLIHNPIEDFAPMLRWLWARYGEAKVRSSGIYHDFMQYRRDVLDGQIHDETFDAVLDICVRHVKDYQDGSRVSVSRFGALLARIAGLTQQYEFKTDGTALRYPGEVTLRLAQDSRRQWHITVKERILRQKAAVVLLMNAEGHLIKEGHILTIITEWWMGHKMNHLSLAELESWIMSPSRYKFYERRIEEGKELTTREVLMEYRDNIFEFSRDDRHHLKLALRVLDNSVMHAPYFLESMYVSDQIYGKEEAATDYAYPETVPEIRQAELQKRFDPDDHHSLVGKVS